MLRHTGQSFVTDQVLRLSASLAFYTVFSLGPMMIVIIFLADLFWGREAVEGRIYAQVSSLIGSKAAVQIQEVMKNATLDNANAFTAAVGVIALLIGATTIFTEIQETINSMWRLKVKYRKGLVQLLLSRLLSFSLVVGLGFLLLVSLVINALVEGFMDQLREHFPHTAIMLFYITNLALTFLIIWFLFGIVYKVLPDALIRWKDVAVGAFFTTLMFMLGKFFITFLHRPHQFRQRLWRRRIPGGAVIMDLLFGHYPVHRCGVHQILRPAVWRRDTAQQLCRHVPGNGGRKPSPQCAGK